MKVKATERGYYDGELREPGEVFDFAPAEKPAGFTGGTWKGDKPASWMETVAESTAPQLRKKTSETPAVKPSKKAAK